MNRFSNHYLVRIQFLGYRYHGWQKQANQKSVHGMVDKTLTYIFQHDNFKTLGCGRTDSKVSALDYAFELFINEPVDESKFLEDLNENFPADIRALSFRPVDAAFNIIQASRTKEYHYYFSFGTKNHPFSAPVMAHFNDELDIKEMQKAAQLFEGLHNFRRFVRDPSDNAVLEREMIKSRIVKNEELFGNFFPADTYVFQIVSSGFLRYQVRLMMSALLEVGRGNLRLEDIKEALENFEGNLFAHRAPASGLMLYRIDFDFEDS